ncbi:MAG: hypothetical protein ACYDCN_11980 [Bacteroidia bacterium]
MKNSITWVKASKTYHEKTPELLLPFCVSIRNQLAVDTDVPVAGSPITLPIYDGMINDLNLDVVARQTSRSTTLTSDELHKASILLHNTDIIVNYIDSVCNQKFPGDITQIETVFARFGLTAVGHGTGHKHIFKIVKVGPKSATLQAPASGQGSTTHFRWTVDQVKWTILKPNHKAEVTIINLPGDVRVYFEYDYSPPVGKGVIPIVDASGDDYHWSSAISEVIPASTTTGNTHNTQ